MACWHRWSKWETFGRFRDSDFRELGFYQRKQCVKCLKLKTRMT